jgi:hypothetical protein
MPPKLVASALYRDGVIVTGKRHADCIKKAVKELDWDIPIQSHEQGFVDDLGNYYNRKDALQIAINAGQISKDFKQILSSEDLW